MAATEEQQNKEIITKVSWSDWNEKLERLITRKNELQDDIMYWRKTIDLTQWEDQFKKEVELMDIGGGPDFSMASLKGMEE